MRPAPLQQVAELDNIGAITYWFTRGMIDNATYTGVLSTCNMSDVGPLLARTASLRQREADWELATGAAAPGSKRHSRPLGFTPRQDEASGRAALHAGLDCDGWTNQAFGLLGGIDIYDSYADVCTTSEVKANGPAAVSARSGSGSNVAAGCANNYDPCRDAYTTAYLNTPKVKAAIHANASIVWTGCSDVVDYSRFDLLTSMLPTYEFLFQQKLKILVYSGDVDAIVPHLGTLSWLNALVGRGTLAQTEAIRSYVVNGQVGGWTTKFDQLTYASVRNSGHFVPELQGERALHLFSSFIDGTPL